MERTVRDQCGDYRCTINTQNFTQGVQEHLHRCGKGVFTIITPFFKIKGQNRDHSTLLSYEELLMKRYQPQCLKTLELIDVSSGSVQFEYGNGFFVQISNFPPILFYSKKWSCLEQFFGLNLTLIWLKSDLNLTRIKFCFTLVLHSFCTRFTLVLHTFSILILDTIEKFSII